MLSFHRYKPVKRGFSVNLCMTESGRYKGTSRVSYCELYLHTFALYTEFSKFFWANKHVEEFGTELKNFSTFEKCLKFNLTVLSSHATKVGTVDVLKIYTCWVVQCLTWSFSVYFIMNDLILFLQRENTIMAAVRCVWIVRFSQFYYDNQVSLSLLWCKLENSIQQC